MERGFGLPELIAVCGVVLLFGFAVLLLMAAFRFKQARSVQRVLVEKLPPGELLGWLKTRHGDKLMEAMSGSPRQSILTSIQSGIVVIASGIGLLVAAAMTGAGSVVQAVAIVLIFVGLGLLLSAYVAYRLAKGWRVLGVNGDSAGERAD